MHIAEERIVGAQPLFQILEQHRALGLGNRGSELRQPRDRTAWQELLALERPLDGRVDVAGVGGHALGVVVLVGARGQASEDRAEKRGNAEQACGERR